METLVGGFEAAFGAVPLPLQQLWGGFAYFVGLVLMVLAFGGFTLRPGGRWSLGRERQAWDAPALASSLLTFVLVLATGYVGSFVVLVPGAQTLESLKDLAVFLCVVLFGYPALLIVPFAYGLSDLAEGVPPDFVRDWLFGYFINPACFWVAHQLIGRNPDFRRAATWRAYLVFVALFMAIEPPLWGHICAGKFTPAVSYGQITPALAFTTAITWVLAPFAMLAALPLARRAGLYWAEIPGHVRHRLLRSRTWVWQSGQQQAGGDVAPFGHSVPIRLALSAPSIALVLVMVGITAYVTQRSAETDAQKLAARLHEEVAENIKLRLDVHLARAADEAAAAPDIGALLRELHIAGQGRAYVLDRAGRLVASSVSGGTTDPVLAAALPRLQPLDSASAIGGRLFSFELLTVKPLARNTWLARVTAYRDRNGGHVDWLLLTVLPEAYYLGGVREGHAESAKVLAAALALSLALAALLAALVTAPIARLSRATHALAREGALAQQLPPSRLEELDVLSESFNDMARQLARQRDNLEQLVAERTELLESLRHAYHDLRRTQQAVMQQERLRALGQMASGIAHDINNAISPVSIYAENLLETEAGISARGRSKLEITVRAIHDVAATVARMTEFYRPREQDALEPMCMNTLVQQVADLTQARWRDMPQQRGVAIRLHMALAPDLPDVPGIESEVREALVNLVFNAVDAMPEGGMLTLRTELAAPSPGTTQASTPVVAVEVEDNGIGMDEATKRRCLEPFFTTKGERGTGLGLAMVYGISERHGASIRIDSTPGQGTRMRLEFPVAAMPAAATTERAARRPAKSLHILLVDDDPLIVCSLTETLRREGHRVTSVAGGQAGIEAMTQARVDGGGFDVVITDLGMPHVDGSQVAAAAKTLNPATAVLLLTGWGRRLVAEGEVPAHVDAVLSKPPRLQELREALAQLAQAEPSAKEVDRRAKLARDAG